MLPFQLIDTPIQSAATPHWLRLILLSLMLHAAVLIVWPQSKPARPVAASALAFQLLPPPPLAEKLTTNKTSPETIRHPSKQLPSTPQRVAKTNSQAQNQAQYTKPLAASAAATTMPASPTLNLNLSSAMANPATTPRQQLVQRHGEKPRPLNTEAPERESVLSQDLKKAIRKDCRKAYSSMGLLAIPLLMKDSVSDDGCDW